MIEEIIQNYLRENAFPCYLSVPEKPSGNFCVLEKTGSSYEDGIFTATLAVQSYGSSDYATLNTDYNFPDTTRKLPRYQAVFEVVHY